MVATRNAPVHMAAVKVADLCYHSLIEQDLRDEFDSRVCEIEEVIRQELGYLPLSFDLDQRSTVASGK